MKKRYVAIMIAIFAGGFGAHKFYLRQPEMGVAYLALFIWLGRFFGLPFTAFLGWYDAFKLMTMDDAEFDRKYNSYFFRDRYGRRRERSNERTIRRGGRYIMIDDEQPKQDRSFPTVANFKLRKQAENLKQSGIKKFKDFDTKGAIQDFKKALETHSGDFALHFNLACAYSLEEQTENAFRHLDLAVANGLREYDKIISHEALAFIRVSPVFEAFRKNHFRLNEQMLEDLKNNVQEEMLEPMTLKNKIPVEISKEV